MTDEQTNETDTKREEDNTLVEDDKTPSQKLKEENDALEKELERAQKIRNEALMAGTAGGRVEPTPPEKPTNKEYWEQVKRGEHNVKRD